jgi:hypothetical protein
MKHTQQIQVVAQALATVLSFFIREMKAISLRQCDMVLNGRIYFWYCGFEQRHFFSYDFERSGRL